MSRRPDVERRTPPRGGDLLALLAGDLVGCELRRGTGGTSLVLVDGQPRFLLETRVERRRLLTLQTTVAAVVGPATRTAAQLVLRHQGQLRRTGLQGVVTGDAGGGQALLERLLGDDELRDASLQLDFTHFVVAPVDGHWRASLELMGGSHVRTTLPPTSRYVGLSTDQLRALVATIAVLRRRLPADDAALVRMAATAGVPAPGGHAPGVDATSGDGGADRDAAARRRTDAGHLPRRSSS